MTFTIPVLNFSQTALEPYISKETLEYHYGKHHQAYINNLNKLIAETEFAAMPLLEIIKKSQGAIFNNAAQHWNHSFYWQCLRPKQDFNEPGKELLAAIDKQFGSLTKFKETFTASASSLFGSGWTWLVKTTNGELEIINTQNAANPITTHKIPLLICDVWEHAYYIDYRNARAKYLENFWHIVNWEFVSQNYQSS